MPLVSYVQTSDQFEDWRIKVNEIIDYLMDATNVDIHLSSFGPLTKIDDTCKHAQITSENSNYGMLIHFEKMPLNYECNINYRWPCRWSVRLYFLNRCRTLSSLQGTLVLAGDQRS